MPMPQCDLLLFVATTTEREQLEAAALARGGKFERIPADDGEANPRESYDLGVLGATRVVAVKTRMGTIGDRASAGQGFHFREKTRATSIICLGMAFGINDALQSYGDVLISQTVFPYDDRDIVGDGDSFRYEYGTRARTYKANPSTLRMLDAQRRKPLDFRVLPGCMLTGNAVVRSRVFRDNLVKWSLNVASGVVGGDMEGSGFLALDPKEDPRWTIVKGICDFGCDDQKDQAEANRVLACRNAATFVLDAVRAWKG